MLQTPLHPAASPLPCSTPPPSWSSSQRCLRTGAFGAIGVLGAIFLLVANVASTLSAPCAYPPRRESPTRCRASALFSTLSPAPEPWADPPIASRQLWGKLFRSSYMRLCSQTPPAQDQRLRTLQAAHVPGTQGARHFSGLDIRLRASGLESTGLGQHAVAPAR